MIKLLRVLRYFILSTITLFLAFLIALRIPFLQNKVISVMLNAINKNNYVNISFESFNISGLTTVDFNNIKISVLNNSSCNISVNKISLSCNPINLILNNKLTIENISIKNININLNNLIKSISGKGSKNGLKFKKLPLFSAFIFVNLKIENCVLTHQFKNESIKTILSGKINNISITNKCIDVDLSELVVNNKYLNIPHFSGKFIYYYNSDSFICNDVLLSSNYFHFKGDLSLLKFFKFLNGKNSFFDTDIELNIDNLLFSIRNLKAIKNDERLDRISDISLKGDVVKTERGFRLNNIFFKYNNKLSSLNFNIDAINNSNFKHILEIDNCEPILDCISDFFLGSKFKDIRSDIFKNIKLNFSGDNYSSIGDIVFLYKNTKVIAKTNLKTDVISSFKNRNFNFLKSIGVNIVSQLFDVPFAKDLMIADLLIETSYDFNTKKNNLNINLNNIFYKNKVLGSINYSGEFNDLDSYLDGKLNIFSQNFNISAVSKINISNYSCLFDGQWYFKNVVLNNFKINKISNDFKITFSKNKSSDYEFDCLLSNGKLNAFSIDVQLGDVKSKITYKDKLVDCSLNSDFVDLTIKDANVSALFLNSKYVLSRIFNKTINENKPNINYKTSLNIVLKNFDIFNLFFYDIIVSDCINIKAFLDSNNGILNNKLSISTKNLLILTNRINGLKLSISNIINSDFIGCFINSTFKLGKDNVRFKSAIKIFTELINASISLKKENKDLLSFKSDINFNKSLDLKLNDSSNYFKILNGKIIVLGGVNINLKNINFDEFIICNENKKIKYVTIDGIYNFQSKYSKDNILDIFNADNKFKISLSNIKFSGLNIYKLKNLYCNLNGEINFNGVNSDIKLFLRNLKMLDIDYNDITLSLYSTLSDNKKLINRLMFKQYDKNSEFVNIYGQAVYSKNFTFFLKLKTTNFKLKCIAPILKDVFSINSGVLNIDYDIKGSPEDIIFNGNGTINNLGIYIHEIGCNFNNITADIFSFSSNDINLYQIKTYQNNFECGSFTATAFLKNLFKPKFSLNGNFTNCNVLNLDNKNKYFYGSLLGNGRLFLNYEDHILKINTDARINNGSLHINCDASGNNNIEVINTRINLLRKFYKDKHSESTIVNLVLNLDFDKNTNINLLFNKYNSLIVNGNGKLFIEYGNDLRITGKYKIIYGMYNLNIYDIFKSVFNIKTGDVVFNGGINNSNINVVAVSGPYITYIDDKKETALLRVLLSGNLYSPKIDYDIQLANITSKNKFKKDFKMFFSILFFNNYDNNRLNNIFNTALNNLIYKFLNNIDNNIKLDINCNLLDIFSEKKFRDLNFNVEYKINDSIKFSKLFDFSKEFSFLKNFNLSLYFPQKNGDLIQNFFLFNTNVDKGDMSESSNNIFSYNLFKKIELM